MREAVLIEQVPELPVECLVLIVTHLENAVLDPEGVFVVLAQLVSRKLGDPAAQVPAVEEAYPFFSLILDRCICTGPGGQQHPHGDQDHSPMSSFHVILSSSFYRHESIFSCLCPSIDKWDFSFSRQSGTIQE